MREMYQEGKFEKAMKVMTFVCCGLYGLSQVVMAFPWVLEIIKQAIDAWIMAHKDVGLFGKIIYVVVAVFVILWNTIVVLFEYSPSILLAVAYVLRTRDRAKAGAVAALAALVMGVATFITGYSTMAIEAVAYLGLPFMLMAYFVSEKEYWQRKLWLMLAISAFGIACVLLFTQSPVQDIPIFTTIGWIGMNLCAFISLMPELLAPLHKIKHNEQQAL